MSAIAIVGMGCRFGGANDLSSYWDLTVEGRNAFTRVPADRFDVDIFFDKNPRSTDKITTAVGAFIDDIYSFPGLAFGIPPRRLEVMDPQHRFALEASTQAIEDAGLTPAQLPRQTGVFIGNTANEFRSIVGARVNAQSLASGRFGSVEDPAAVLRSIERIVPARPYSASGVLTNMTAAIVAQELDLHGPAYTLDAACASSLVAVNTAVHQLQSGTIDAAIAGGVYLCLTPEHYVAFGKIGAMSRSGVCRPFDARADGFIQGDGAGAVLLKRLDDAIRDGDRIYAVIHGVATNNDGRGDGPMAPNWQGQSEAIRAAWDRAKLDRSTLGYAETHGTGTDVGDATEFKGLMAVHGETARRTALGSTKANVGHTNSAAGVAGLIRATLALYHGVIPPMANFESSKDELGIENSPFFIPKVAEDWTGEHRSACVSSFGFGGTNAHTVLGTAPACKEAVHREPRSELFVLSAPSEEELRQLAARTATSLAHQKTSAANVARTLAHRSPQAFRAAFVADDLPAFRKQLDQFAAGEQPAQSKSGQAKNSPKLAFLFPGQGSQRIGMLRGIRGRFPVVAETLQEMERELLGLLKVPLTHLLYPEQRLEAVSPEKAQQQLTDTAHQQPVLHAVGVALNQLLTHIGIQPTVVAGHSLGEFTAAAAAGVVEPGAAARFVARRGRAMADLPGDHGAMAAIVAEADVVRTHLVDGAVIANFNHPRQCVVSGTAAAVATVSENAARAGLKVVPLDVSHAFHSPVLADLDPTPWLRDLPTRDPRIAVASGIVNRVYQNAADATEVFKKHAVSPVNFVGALENCVAQGAEVYLQVGAGGPLAAFARGCLPKGTPVYTLASMDDDDKGASLLETLGALWCEGVAMDVAALTDATSWAILPPSVLPREKYWAVKDEPQAMPTLAGVAFEATPKVEKSAAPAPPPAAAPETTVDPLLDKVLAVVAKVSAYPKASLRVGMRLQEDLGFDSIMVGDLATGLAEAFPGLGGIPQELLINKPTVQVIVDFARSAGKGPAIAQNDDAPVQAYTPTWVSAPLPALPERSLRSVRAVFVGVSPFQSPALESRMLSPGEAAHADAVDLLVFGPSVTLHDAFGVLAHQDRQGGRPDVLFHCLEADLPGFGALAASLSREWSTVCKAISGAADLRKEWLSADRTPIVRYSPHRQIPGLAPASSSTTWTPGPAEKVLISGGTRGIGAKLAKKLVDAGCQVWVLGRGESEVAGAIALRADVTDATAVQAAVGSLGITTVIHAAGVLADGPIGQVSPDLARQVKLDGWQNLRAATPNARVRLAIGSWAGRFGNRHQTAYAIANALLAADVDTEGPVREVVAEFGPWAQSEMVKSIPAPVQQAMRADGIDFVSDEAGLTALLHDLGSERGVITHGRSLPSVQRQVSVEHTLSTETHPYLLDHAIEGTPVLPLASAADLIAEAASLECPFELSDLRLFQGITVKAPVQIRVTVNGDRAEIRLSERHTLCYRARVRPTGMPEVAPAPSGGSAPTLPLKEFYRSYTFHGPLLQGIASIVAVGDDFVRGKVTTGSPSRWIPGTSRARFAIDPLALDSAMQLCGYVAWTKYKRAGTPVGISRLVQCAPWPSGEVEVSVRFGAAEGDRFTGHIEFRAGDRLIGIADGVTAELKQVEGSDFEVKPEWTDPGEWPAIKDLEMRLAAVGMIGIRNPYFAMHEGTARNITQVGGRELVNFSSYNYLGLSGDPRVIADVEAAIHQYGTSVSASRVASGQRPFHVDLERELAVCQGVEDSLVFTAGHATNVTTIGHLFGANDLILHDELIHDSALQGIKLSGAARRAFKHDEPAHLENQLKQLRKHYEKVLIIVEGVYSMDGDICDLPAYIALKKKYGALLMVDEAHSFGIIGKTGCGAREHFDIPGSDVDLWMGTLSKSLASCGGWIAGSARLINYLRYTAPGFIYSAGLTPANGQAALSSLRLMLAEPERVDLLQRNARFFQSALVERGVDTGPAKGGSAVVPAVTGNSMHALMLSQRLQDQGINVQPIVYPAVADDAARLRFFISSTHTMDQLRWTADRVAETLRSVRTEFPAP